MLLLSASCRKLEIPYGHIKYTIVLVRFWGVFGYNTQPYRQLYRNWRLALHLILVYFGDLVIYSCRRGVSLQEV
jgi:hypothetical protein